MKVNQRILILCEGLTEYCYARALQNELPGSLQQSVLVEIDYTCHDDPKQLVDEAVRRTKKARKERNPFDQVWLFFERGNTPCLDSVFEIINKYGFKAAFSSICLENWFILHFADCELIFESREEAIEYLKQFWPEYHRSKSKPYQHLRQSLPMAIERARSLQAKVNNSQVLHHNNPYFSVADLIDFFENLKPQPSITDEK